MRGRNVALSLLASALTGTVLASDAMACFGADARMFPACEISAPRPDERVTVIYANSGKGLSTVTLGGDDVVTEVADVEIGVADKPHYIVVSSGKAIVWRFTGRVDTISRLVVLGSQYDGAARTGIVGVPRERILFSMPDLKQLLGKPGRNWCLSVYRACEASAYFDIPRANQMVMPGALPAQRHPVEQFVEHLKAGIIRIPEDGWVEAGGRGWWRKKSDDLVTMSGLAALGRYEPDFGTDRVETSQSYERGAIEIDARTVISQETVRDYTIPPATAGIQQLLSAGKLVGPDDPQFGPAYKKWNEEISLPYRSKFDPSFLFSYKIDYLITQPVKLPADLYKKSFLVAEGVETPDFNSNEMACLFFADRRVLKIVPRKERDPRCDTALGAGF